MSSATLLADTNILSYAHNEHTFWQAYQKILSGHTVLIASQTVAELRFGAFRVGWGERRIARLEALIKAYPVVYPNDAVCTRWARVRAHAEHRGRQLGGSDAWIAATALELGVPLVTHNKKDFEFIDDLTVISEQDA